MSSVRLLRQSVILLAALLFVAPSSFAEDPKELVFVFQKQKDPAKIKAEADRVAHYLSKELSMPVRTQVPSDYSASVQALISKKADVAYVDSMSYLLAKRDGGASVLLAEQRVDPQGVARTEYDSVFVVRKDSPLKTFDDLKKSANKLQMVFTSPTSTSGYIMAYRRFVNDHLLNAGQDPKEVFDNVSFGGSYAQALRQVISGHGDVAAVSYYAIEGKAADRYLKPHERAQLRVLARTPGVPTHMLITRAGISDATKTKIKNALLKMSKERPELLGDVYGAARFVEVDGDDHVAATKEAATYLKLPVISGVKEKIGGKQAG